MFDKLGPPKEYGNLRKMSWWDMMRIMTHGSYDITITNSRLRLLSGINPYDPVGYLDMLCDELKGSYKTGEYRILMQQFKAINNPSLSNFPNLAEFPVLVCCIPVTSHTFRM